MTNLTEGQISVLDGSISHHFLNEEEIDLPSPKCLSQIKSDSIITRDLTKLTVTTE